MTLNEKIKSIIENDRAFNEKYKCVQPCSRIIALGKGLGVELTFDEAERIWRWHSERQDAQWLSDNSYSDGEVANVIVSFVMDKARALKPD